MVAAGVFLAGAKSRLLPMSVPFRYFGAAVVFHGLAWLALLADAGRWPRFAGGLGWPLAALHLVTLGVLVMCAIGASLQLLPVATRQPIGDARWPAAIWWLYTPGVAALTLGMGLPSPPLLALGGGAVLLALVGYAALLAVNLRGARGMPVVVAHGWGAWVALLLLLATAASLVGGYVDRPLWARPAALAQHLSLAAYGFMGLLALGLSHILVPMFALGPAPAVRPALASCALAGVALVVAVAAGAGVAPHWLWPAAVAAGALAVGAHLWLMRQCLRAGLRRELGPSFRLVRAAWAALALSLPLALALALGLPWDGALPLFGLLLIAGWLLTFVLGILYRVLPFLASMHAARGQLRPPTPSALSAPRPLRWHFTCHGIAVGTLALAIVFDSAQLTLLGAGVGAVGAVAFAVHFVILLQRLRAGAAPPT